jgi:hypothetical protein
MPDTKITALTAITTVDPAVDVLPIVDVSDTTMAASGTTKKITTNQILGAGGTATLASATISGNLTVDTNTFAVDASTNRVFVGTAPISTAYPFYVTRGGTAGSIAQFTDGTAQTLTIDSAAGGLIVGNANNGYLEFVANGLAQHRIAPLGVFSWYDGAGGTRMTLNSTGLGVGASPGLTGGSRRALTVNAPTGQLSILELAVNGSTTGYLYSNATQTQLVANGATFLAFETNAVERLRIDSSGNVGVGVTTFGTSAAKVLSIATGTEPTTGPTGTVQWFTSTRSANNTIPAIFTEGSGVTNAAITNVTVTNKIALKVNGTIYYLLATTSAA